jgi:hypothetical protein
MLQEAKTRWHWLERTLNEVIRAVNQQKPLPSATIAIEESPNGTLLKVIPAADNQVSISAGNTLNAVVGAGQQPPSQQQPPQQVIWHGVNWKVVTVTDPISCTQSNITILVQEPGSNIQIQ